jgi:hypothetical protein
MESFNWGFDADLTPLSSDAEAEGYKSEKDDDGDDDDQGYTIVNAFRLQRNRGFQPLKTAIANSKSTTAR